MEPLFEIGLLADVQYADLDDGHVEDRCQRHREAPGKLSAALKDLASRRLDCVVHLGDIINGNTTDEASLKDFDLIARIFDTELTAHSIPAVHVLGNHCLSVSRSTLLDRLNIPPQGYFTRQLPNNWRLIVLDTTEISGHSGYAEGSWQWVEAREYEAAHPLSAEEPQMSPWNGGISKQQMAWLISELTAAETRNECVIVASHHQIHDKAARATHVAWNCKEIERVCVGSPAFKLALAGHDHLGGAFSFPTQHFVTLEALLEAPSVGNAYAVLRVFEDHLEIVGEGTVTSRVLKIE